MADWRQIQARIRKAKASSEPLSKLAQLFDQTHDAMVAFELATLNEKSGQLEDASRWYLAAAERFRRAAWKKKAQEALERLAASPAPPAVEPLPPEPVEEHAEVPIEEPAASLEASAEPAEVVPAAGGRKRRHRGRRGGRGRRRKKAAEAAPIPPKPPEPVRPEPMVPPPREMPPAPVARAVPIPSVEARPPAGRAGEPAFASRLAQLEAQLRRLIASQVHPLGEVDQAPAGPGVFLLSDADQMTHYYVEACRTLRIGLDHAVRSGKGKGSVRARLAEHLHITEARATKYLKEHCVVRWLQREEDASALAHFAVAVLRPTLNE